MTRPARFAYVDEGEALRRLDLDRDSLLAYVAAGRLKAYPGVGKGSFYRVADLDALAAEIAPGAAPEEAAATEADGLPARKQFDPAYKVHLRLQADLKWYDLSDDDLRAWAREMTAEGYTRQRSNITRLLERLERLRALMDEAAAGWKVLAPPPQPPAPTRTFGKPLPMAGAPRATTDGEPQP